MEKIQVPDHNVFEEKSKAFYESQKAKQLQKKYQPSPFEEEHKPLYYLAQVVSYLANIVSVITASTWLFTYIFSIIQELPSPTTIATLVTGALLIILEVLQRILGVKFFKNLLQFNKTLIGSLIMMFFLGGTSFILSFNGSFDFIKTVTSPPLYQAPELVNIESIRKQHQTFVDDAEKIATDYYNSRKYKNRIATEDAEKYQEYLDKKIEYQDKLLTAVSEGETKNESRILKTKEEHKQALTKYDKANNAKGWGLGGISIISIALFYFCLWYIEYYDFKTVTQYGVLVTKAGNETADIKEIEGGNNSIDYEKMMQLLVEQNKEIEDFKKNPSPTPPEGEKENKKNGHEISANNALQLPIGFFSEGQRKEQAKKLYIQHIQAYIQELEKVNKYHFDKHTIQHRNFKTGLLEHLDFGTVNNRVGIYLLKIQKSIRQENPKTLVNQYQKLSYWVGKRGEFLNKPTVT